jgi:hypothetical protein
MSENSNITATADDFDWARKLKSRVGRQFFRSTADAIVADALGKALEKKQDWRVAYLLETPLPSLFTKQPSPLNPDGAFEDAWKGLSDTAQEKARYKFPSLSDNHRTAPLTAAALAGDLETVKLLAEKGASPFYRTDASPTGYGGALGAAIFRGQDDIVSFLMSQPAVKQELDAEPKFRNYLLLTALGTDCAATLAHLAKCDPDLLEKGRVYGDHKASEFTLGEGIFAAREKLKLQRAFEESQQPKTSKYGDGGPKYRPREPSCNKP